MPTSAGSCWCRSCRPTPTRSPTWLSERRGARVALRVPQRGDKRALLETVARNAAEALNQHKLRRAGDLTTRSQALEEITEALGMDTAPLRIECYDVSQIQGTDVVASMVVFEDGLPRKSEYRRFMVRGRAEPTTWRALSEVLRRRFTRYLEAAAARRDRGGDLRRPGPPRHRPGRPASRASSRTRRSWWWSTAASAGQRAARCSPTSASPTSRCAGWPSGWRRCGCPGRSSR